MTSADYIWHVTLDTGHGRRSLRNEIDAATITIVRQQIDEALAAGSAAILEGYTLTATTPAGALLATVTGNAGPLAIIGVARSSLQSAALWRRLDAEGAPPSPPWCAVRLQAPLASDLDAAGWLGDYERCIAWAWLAGKST